MPPWGPTSRQDLIAALKRHGFDGPYPGGRHEFMYKDNHRLIIPNPHRNEIDLRLLSLLVRQVGISRAEWESL